MEANNAQYTHSRTSVRIHMRNCAWLNVRIVSLAINMQYLKGKNWNYARAKWTK